MGAAVSISNAEENIRRNSAILQATPAGRSDIKDITKYYPQVNFPVLQFSNCVGFKQIYNDKGTGAKMDGSIWKPISPDGYYIIGYFAKNDYQCPDNAMCIKDALLESPHPHVAALAMPIGFEMVWSNKGSWFLRDGQNGRELAIYRPIPPSSDYLSLGYICVCSFSQSPKPSDVMFSTIRCVHTSLLATGGLDRLAWQSAGCSPTQEMSLWNTTSAFPTSIPSVGSNQVASWLAAGTFQIRLDLQTSRLPSDSAHTFLAEPPASLFTTPSTGDDISFENSHDSRDDSTVFVSGKWTEVRVFISSTFVDMHGERDVLVKSVFPGLNEQLRRENRWVRMIPIDLRWGVLPEQTKRIQQTCLNEIDACTSPLEIELQAIANIHGISKKSVLKQLPSHQLGRPWVLALRGERYGWVQGTYAPSEDFLRADRVRLWMSLLERKGIKLSITSMELLHSSLSFSSLLYRANEPLPNSVSDAEGNSSALIHSFAYFRSPDFKEKSVPPELQWVFDFDYIARGAEDHLLPGLKEQYTIVENYDDIVSDLEQINEMSRRARDVCLCRDYSVAGSVVKVTGSLPSGRKFATGSCIGLEHFSKVVYEDLYKAVCLEFPVLANDPEPLTVQRILHESAVTARTAYFFGREDILGQLESFCLSGLALATETPQTTIPTATATATRNSMVVWGDPGCGKSTLIAKFYSRLKSKVGTLLSANSFIWIHIVSATPESYQVLDLLYRLCCDLVKHYGLLITVDKDLSLLRFQLVLVLKEVARKLQYDEHARVVIILDAVNQMSADGGAYSLSWLPFNDLPKCVRLIVTTLPHACLDNARLLADLVRPVELQVMPLDDESRKDLVRSYLSQYNKRLSEDSSDSLLKDQMAIILSKQHGYSPLYLMAVCELLVTFGGVYELMTKFIEDLGGTIPAIFEQLLVLLEVEHGVDLVRHSMSLVACSPSGMTELEMIEIMHDCEATSMDDDDDVDKESNTAVITTMSNFSRLYAQTRLFLGGSGSGRMQFFHDQLLFVVRRRYGLDPPTVGNRVYCFVNKTLAEYFANKIINKDSDSFHQAVTMYAYHLLRAGPSQWPLLVDTLCSISFLQIRCECNLLPVMMQDLLDTIQMLQSYRGEEATGEGGLPTAQAEVQRLTSMMIFIRKRMSDLTLYPTLALQIACNERPDTAAHRGALQYFTQNTSLWLRAIPISPLSHVFQQLNKPEEEGHLIGSLRGHYHYVSDLDFDPSDSLLLSGSFDGTMKVWDVQSCSEKALMKGHIGNITCCLFFHSGQYVISGGEDGTVRCWQASTGLQVSSTAVGGAVTSVAISEKSSDPSLSSLFISATTTAGNLTVYHGKSFIDGASPPSVASTSQRQPAAMDAALHPNPRLHQLCICGYNNGDLILYDYSRSTSSATEVRKKKLDSVVATVVFIPHIIPSYSGCLVAVGTYQKTISILETSSLNVLQVVEGSFGWIYKLRVSGDGKDLIVKHRSRAAALIGAFPSEPSSDPKSWKWRRYGHLSGHQAYITSVTFSNTSSMLGTGSEDKSIMLWKNPLYSKTHSSSDGGSTERVRGVPAPSSVVDYGEEMFRHGNGCLKVMFFGNSTAAAASVAENNESPVMSQCVVSFGETNFAVHSSLTGEVLLKQDHGGCSNGAAMTSFQLSTTVSQVLITTSQTCVSLYDISFHREGNNPRPIVRCTSRTCTNSVYTSAISAIAVMVIPEESSNDLIVCGFKDASLKCFLMPRRAVTSSKCDLQALSVLGAHAGMTHAAGCYVQSIDQCPHTVGGSGSGSGSVMFVTTGDDDAVIVWRAEGLSAASSPPTVAVTRLQVITGHRNLVNRATLCTLTLPPPLGDTGSPVRSFSFSLSCSEDRTVRAARMTSNLREVTSAHPVVSHDNGVKDLALVSIPVTGTQEEGGADSHELYLFSASSDGSVRVNRVRVTAASNADIVVTPVASLSAGGEVLSCAAVYDRDLAGKCDPKIGSIYLGFRVVVGLSSGYALFYVI